jgi:hypothetical protein
MNFDSASDAGDDPVNLGSIFEGREEISHRERGDSFRMARMTYYRMARTANNLSAMGVEPAVLAHLPGGQPGCLLTLFGQKHMFEITVRVRRNDTAIHTKAHRLGGLQAIIPLCSDYDNDAGWSRVLRAIAAAEGIGFYDSHWAAEMGGGEADQEG